MINALICMMVVTTSGSAAEDAAVAAARGAVSERLSAPETSIHLVDVEAAQWGDASLGCPEKGQSYAQVVTSGYRVRLRVNDRTFDVRVSGERAVLCERGGGREGGASAATRLYRLARRDLAGRLGVPETEIEVSFLRPTVWPDEALGCGKAAAETETPPTRVQGYLIGLSAGGKAYEYHSDQARVILCEDGD